MGRDLYERGHFPLSYVNVRPKTTITLAANNVPGDEILKDRVKTVLAVWGGNADRIEDIEDGRNCLEVFGIPVPNILDLKSNASVQPPVTIAPNLNLRAIMPHSVSNNIDTSIR